MNQRGYGRIPLYFVTIMLILSLCGLLNPKRTDAFESINWPARHPGEPYHQNDHGQITTAALYSANFPPECIPEVVAANVRQDKVEFLIEPTVWNFYDSITSD